MDVRYKLFISISTKLGFKEFFCLLRLRLLEANITAMIDWFRPTNFYLMDEQNLESGIADKVEGVHTTAQKIRSKNVITQN